MRQSTVTSNVTDGYISSVHISLTWERNISINFGIAIDLTWNYSFDLSVAIPWLLTFNSFQGVLRYECCYRNYWESCPWFYQIHKVFLS